jgi:hypothetical protein
MRLVSLTAGVMHDLMQCSEGMRNARALLSLHCRSPLVNHPLFRSHNSIRAAFTHTVSHPFSMAMCWYAEEARAWTRCPRPWILLRLSAKT